MNSFKEIIKFIIYTSNTILSVSSLTLVSIGIVNIGQHATLFHRFGNKLCIGSAALFLGFVMLTVAVLGYYANCSEKKQFLLVYAVLLIGLFVGQVFLGIWASVALHREEGIGKGLESEFERRYNQNSTNFFNDLDKIQKKFSCCGVHGPKDYDKLPESCCKKIKNQKCMDVYPQGCLKLYTHSMDTSFKLIGYIAFVFSLPEPITAWLALLLRANSRSPEPVETYQSDETTIDSTD